MMINCKKTKSISELLASSLIFLMIVTACHGPQLMTLKSYEEVAVGQRIDDLEYKAGAPYEKRKSSPDLEEYIYVERVTLSGSRDLFREYIFTISQGKVIHKQIKEVASPSLHFQSQ
ncbi:MAG: hypothetical protein JWO53_1217 [Chlamydiia bacterium]|nr:hypothetical protein [Chlamydiia bacterium]